MSIVVGIDLGTTNSVVCYKDSKGEYNFVKDESGRELIPSVVCFTEPIQVGREAVDCEEDFPEVTIRSSKRYIGEHTKLIKDFNACDVAKHILEYLKQITDTYTEEDIEGIVITVPAYFNQNQRLETKKAAEQAGLNVLRIINEPTAAALAYGEDTKVNELVLVYDLGGGTFDVTLLELTDQNIYTVLSTSGNTKLGGDDFDDQIIDYFKSTLPFDLKTFKDFDVRLKKFAEEIKFQLNYKTEIKKTLKYCGLVNNRIYHHELSINNETYKKLIDPLLIKTKIHVLNALNDASKKISNLSKIILVGGSTKSTFVRNFVKDSFNTKIYHEIDPDLTVAAGAANLAYSITNKSHDDTLLIDVTPLSLGIETKGGLLTKIIPRNTNIPVSASQEFKTAEDNQESVNIRIYQGERPLSKDNELLGEFVLSGFEKRPRGQTKIIVKFEIDSSGLITVTAFDKISGMQSDVTLKPLTSETVNRLLDDIEAHESIDKIISDTLETQDLLNDAKTLILSKKMKGENVDDYEASLELAKEDLQTLRSFVSSMREF